MNITLENVRQIFPAAAAENPYCGEPYWVLQASGLVLAYQILRLTDPGDLQQRALFELRRSLDLALLATAIPPDAEVRRRLSQTLAPYQPTPLSVVFEMLKLAQLNDEDVLYDLGSGDGRIVIAAARDYGCRAVGIEIDPMLVAQAEEAARAEEVDELTEFLVADVRDVGLAEATVVTTFLLTSSMQLLQPTLRALRPGTRIVSHNFDMTGWPPKRESVVHDHRLYLWEV